MSLVLFSLAALGKTKTIHIFVALCDNKHQGIVPVPEALGNGQDPKNNLYWGAAYGVKSFMMHKAPEWTLQRILKSNNPNILERLLFKHATEDVYLLAEAYDGAKMKACLEDFFTASNGQCPLEVKQQDQTLCFGGDADLLSFVGHDGLMDFYVQVNPQYNGLVETPKDVIILSCYSKNYFSAQIKKARANPILWTNSLMAPEAYTLTAAIEGWIYKKGNEAIKERAAQAYNTYQKCGINASRNLFATGF